MFKSIEIDIHERLNGLEQAWLVNHLEAKGGVRAARFSPRRDGRLVVAYDPGTVSSYTIWERCHLCGLRAAFVLPDHALGDARPSGAPPLAGGALAAGL